ncbi:MAG: hypothetical protein J0I19_06955 [Alphaproteobacteria bacterium]|nr:hypothetical protein [Alphaproteobacteria bacterium]
MSRLGFQKSNLCAPGGAGTALILAGLALPVPALALDIPSLPQFQAEIGDAQLSVGGTASGAVFDSNLKRQPGLSGSAKLMPRLHRDYDSGLSLGLNATLAVSDALSRGRYGGDFFEKVFGEVRTGLGRVEIGQTDGAGYVVAAGGPKVDAQVSLDDPQTTFFRDPVTGHAATDLFALRTAVGASSNYAKFAYVSPALFGAQLALSFTPNQGKQVLPFLTAGPDVPGRQAAIWEAGLRYSTDFGPVNLTGYGGIAEGRGEHKLGRQEGVSDLGAGLRADYVVDDELSLSLGGSYRHSNAYAFDITQSFDGATTRALHVSAAATYGSWVWGVEVGNAVAGSPAGLPRLELNGYQASLGYVLNNNWQITGGWQRLDYARSSGAFFNGGPRLNMNAGFLHLNLHV